MTALATGALALAVPERDADEELVEVRIGAPARAVARKRCSPGSEPTTTSRRVCNRYTCPWYPLAQASTPRCVTWTSSRGR